MFEGPFLNGRFGKTDRETVYLNCQALCTMGRKTWRHGVPHEQNCAVCGDNLAKINMIYHFYAPGQLEYSWPGLAPDILKMEFWTHMGRTANIIIKDIIHIFASMCKNMRILVMGRLYRERWVRLTKWPSTTGVRFVTTLLCLISITVR